jgi:hypothetical protein
VLPTRDAGTWIKASNLLVWHTGCSAIASATQPGSSVPPELTAQISSRHHHHVEFIFNTA